MPTRTALLLPAAADLAQGVGVTIVHHVKATVHVHADRTPACSTQARVCEEEAHVC
jgi:hypothetical protein